MLYLEAPKAIDWEAKLSLPDHQAAGILTALGLQLGPHPAEDAVQRLKNQKDDREEKASPSIGGYPNICKWSLWPGATVLVVGGLLALAFQWRTLGQTFASIFAVFGRRRNARKGPLDHLEIPMSWFLFGVIFVGMLAIVMLAWFFHVTWWMGVLAVVMTFFLSAVAARAGAETSINPIGALGKVTQLTFGVLAPGNISANLMTAGVTAGAACSCCDTVGNLKVGHMVGANPRRQFISQLFGVLAGAVLAVPAYFLLVPDVNILGGEKFPAPSALVWKGVAEVLSKGLSSLPPSALWAMGVAFVVGVVIVVVDNLFPNAQALHALADRPGHRLDHPRLSRPRHVPRRIDRLDPGTEGGQVKRNVHHPRRIRLHRRRKHHGRHPRAAGGDGRDALIRRRTVIAPFLVGLATTPCATAGLSSSADASPHHTAGQASSGTRKPICPLPQRKHFRRKKSFRGNFSPRPASNIIVCAAPRTN